MNDEQEFEGRSRCHVESFGTFGSNQHDLAKRKGGENQITHPRRPSIFKTMDFLCQSLINGFNYFIELISSTLFKIPKSQKNENNSYLKKRLLDGVMRSRMRRI